MLLFASTLDALNLDKGQVYVVGGKYTIGPKALRRRAEMKNKRRSEDLKRAILEHKNLHKEFDTVVSGTHLYTIQTELKELKYRKLKAKDRIQMLLRQERQRIDDHPNLELGMGGFGKVVFGRCSTGKEMAIKIAKGYDYCELKQEYMALRLLSGKSGFPRVVGLYMCKYTPYSLYPLIFIHTILI